MVQRLVADLKGAAAPACVQPSDKVNEGVDFPLPIAEYFLKIPDGSAANYECKCHCSSKSDYQVVACNRLTADECIHVGRILPEPSTLCKFCARARTEVALMFAP